MPSKKEIEAAAEALHYSQSDNGKKWPNDLADYERENLRIDARAVLEAALAPGEPVQAHIEHTNGKRWRIESADGRWTIQPEGQITADEARVLCERILSALTAGEPAQVPSGWRPIETAPKDGEPLLQTDVAQRVFSAVLAASALCQCSGLPQIGE